MAPIDPKPTGGSTAETRRRREKLDPEFGALRAPSRRFPFSLCVSASQRCSLGPISRPEEQSLA
jgi:hypothetical protein